MLFFVRYLRHSETKKEYFKRSTGTNKQITTSKSLRLNLNYGRKINGSLVQTDGSFFRSLGTGK